MSALDAVLKDFAEDVERVEHLLILIKAFREFGASVPPDYTGSDPWIVAKNLHEQSKSRRTDLPILSGSLQLYLAGRFEYCVRQIVEVLADEIASKATRYADLPDAVRASLKTWTLEIAQNPKRYGFDDLGAEALLADLVANLSSSGGPVSIRSSVLSITEANMKDRVIAELLKRVGMQEYWKDLGKQASVKLALEKATDAETTSEAQSRLNAIMEERNQVAHPTGSTAFPDPDKVMAAAKFLRTLATTTVELAKVYLAAYKQAS